MVSSSSSVQVGFSVVPFVAETREVVVEELPRRTLGRSLATRVTELFEAECREREERGLGSGLYDAALFSLVQDPTPEGPSHVTGRYVAYSEWVAQMREPELREDLGIRALGVTGVILSGGAIWLGRRSPSTFLLPGLWELCPSGGVDFDARTEAGKVEPARQLGLELEQELGWPAARIESAVPFALVEDLEVCVVDITYRLALQGSDEELHAAVEARANREYDRIEGFPVAGLAGFVAEEGAKISPVSIAMLEAGGWLPTR